MGEGNEQHLGGLSLLSAPFVLCVLLGLPAMADDREKLLGDWRLVSFYTEDVETKQRNDVYGEHPIGHAALTAAGRLFAVITANGRKPPNGSEEQAAAFRSMIAYTGKFRVESEKFITQVDTAWNEARPSDMGRAQCRRRILQTSSRKALRTDAVRNSVSAQLIPE
jgi:Lipocalin-like domain